MATPLSSDWPPGDGETARRIRALDWAANPLGSMDRWPLALRVALTSVLDSPIAAILAWGPGLTTFYNDAYRPLLGDKQEALGRPLLDVWGEARNTIAPQIADALAGRSSFFENASFTILRSDSPEEAFFDYSCSPVRDETGAVRGVLTIAIEATSRVRAERRGAETDKSLRMSEERLSVALEALPVAVGIVDENGRTILANKPLQRYLPTGAIPSRDPDRLPRWRSWRPDGKLLAPHDFPGARALRGERVVPGTEMLYTGDDGHDVWTSVAAVPIADGQGRSMSLVIAISDIDALKRTADLLRESEERQVFLLKLSDALRSLADPIGIQQVAMKLLAEWLGVMRASYFEVEADQDAFMLTARHEAENAAPLPDRMRLSDFGADMSAAYRSGRTLIVPDTEKEPVAEAQHAAYRAIGIRAWTAVPLVKDGVLTAIVGIHSATPRDWTGAEVQILEDVAERTWAAVERARTEAALREREADLARVQRIGEVGGVDIDIAGGLLGRRSPEYLRLHGLPTETRQERHEEWLARVHPDDRARAQQTLSETLNGAATSYDSEYRIVRPSDGTVRWIRARGDIERDAAGNAVRLLGAHLDVTEQKNLEEALRAGEETQAFLLKFSDLLRAQPDMKAVGARATRFVVDALKLDRFYIASLDVRADRGEVTHEAGREGLPSLLGTHRLSHFPTTLQQAFAHTIVFDDVARQPGLTDKERQSFAALGMGAFIGVPLRKEHHDIIWGVGAVSTEPRRWTAAEVALVEEMAERIWAALEHARAEDALRLSERVLRRNQGWLAAQKEAFRSAMDGEPMEDSLGILTDAAADQMDGGSQCAFYLADRDGKTLNHLVGMPNARAIESFEAASDWLAYGLASTGGQPVIMPDVRQEQGWQPWLQLAREHDFRACWSFPIETVSRRLVGSFVLYFREPRRPTSRELEQIAALTHTAGIVISRYQTEAALRESEERFRQFAQASSGALWIRNATTLEMEYVSPAIETVYGAAPETFSGDLKHWAALILPEDRDLAMAHIEQARQGSSSIHEFRIQRPDDRAFRWIRNVDFPLHDAEGRIQRIGGIAEDVTLSKLAVEHQGILLSELQHRVRNIMAIIRSIVRRTGETAPSVTDYSDLLAGRLMTLARVQALLTRGANVGVPLATIVENELRAQATHAEQYTIEGDDVVLAPKAAEVVTLAVHELATNALKYGALSSEAGHVAVTWSTAGRNGTQWLVFDWQERGGPRRRGTAHGPRRQGFGSELIEGRVPYELGGRADLRIEPGGAQCHLTFPLADGGSVLETDAPNQAKVFGGILDMTGEADFKGQHVLVLEDDYFLAADTARALRGVGAEIVGPCRSEDAALEEIKMKPPSSAVIDINLGHGPTFRMAGTLKANGVPFVFITGYDDKVIPPEFAHVPVLQKPVLLRQVVRLLADAVAAHRA